MFRLTLLFILCFSTSLLSQRVSGTITDEDQNPLPAVLVFNMKTAQKSYTNINGEFIIGANLNDELRFIRNGFERNSKVVNQQDFNSPLKMIIIRTIQEIEEVKVPSVRLTGDLNQDSRNLTKFDKVAQLQQQIGVPGPPEKPRETPPPTVEQVGTLGFVLSNINLFTLYKNLSGDGRRMRNLYKYEDLQDNVVWIRERVGDDYFTKMGIPPEKISEFLQYSLRVKPELSRLIKTRNLSKVLFILEETLPNYLHR